MPVFILVLDRIAQRIPCPLGIDRSIRGDLGVPVEERCAVCRSEPACKRISFFRRILRFFGLFILGNGLGFYLGSAAVHLEADGECGRDPLGVDRHVMAGHLVEGIRILQCGIGIPAAPAIVAVVDRGRAGRLCRLVIIGGSADICLKIHIFDRSQLRAAEVILYIILGAVIIEIVYIAGDIIITGLLIADIYIAVAGLEPRSIRFGMIESIYMII